MSIDRVERDETPVMFVRGNDDQADIGRAWAELEEVVGSLKGRKFYGAVDKDGSEYRACVEIRDGDDPAALGLEAGSLPGGTYLRARIGGEPPRVYELIVPAFQELARTAARDDSRPEIEFYRRHDAIDLLMPVADDPA